jgi:predicted phage-related endonuclease
MPLLASTILSPPILTTPAVMHGRVHEQSAVKRFEEVTGKKVQPCGLFVDHKSHFLAASPDGLLVKEDFLLEIKCPYKGRDSKIDAGELFDFLEIREGEKKLKLNHNYFFQVQGQLKICRKSSCYFVTYTFEDILIEKIEYDDAFFSEKIFPALDKFYKDNFLPCVTASL